MITDLILLDIPNGWKTAIMVIAMVFVFIFFFIRPSRQKEKQEKAYHNGLKRGDQVMTLGGIHCTVLSNAGGKATVEIAKGVQIKVLTDTLVAIPAPKADAKKSI